MKKWLSVLILMSVSTVYGLGTCESLNGLSILPNFDADICAYIPYC